MRWIWDIHGQGSGGLTGSGHGSVCCPMDTLIPLQKCPEQGRGDRDKLCSIEQATSESCQGEERSILCTEAPGA